MLFFLAVPGCRRQLCGSAIRLHCRLSFAMQWLVGRFLLLQLGNAGARPIVFRPERWLPPNLTYFSSIHSAPIVFRAHFEPAGWRPTSTAVMLVCFVNLVSVLSRGCNFVTLVLWSPFCPFCPLRSPRLLFNNISILAVHHQHMLHVQYWRGFSTLVRLSHVVYSWLVLPCSCPSGSNK